MAKLLYILKPSGDLEGPFTRVAQVADVIVLGEDKLFGVEAVDMTNQLTKTTPVEVPIEKTQEAVQKMLVCTV